MISVIVEPRCQPCTIQPNHKDVIKPQLWRSPWP